jgi:two-component system, sensor histidine kinase PdtaS
VIVDSSLELVPLLSRAARPEDLAIEIVHAVCRLAGADSCDLLLREPDDRLSLRASTVVPDLVGRVKLGKGIGLCGVAMTNCETVVAAENAQDDSRFARYPGYEYPGCEAIVVVPMRNGEGACTGVLLLRKCVAWDPSVDEILALEAMAATCNALISGFDHAFQAGNNSNRLGALSAVTNTIAQSPYLEEILQLLVNLTAQQFNFKVCTVRLLDETRGELVLRATQAPAKAYQRKRAIKLGESIAGRALDQNKPQIVKDVQSEADYIGHDLAVEQGLRSMICVPMMMQDRPIGVLSCYTSEVREFLPDEIKALETLAKQAAFSIENAKLQVRTTLMQEMHHRVKNNLQQVASLLRIQMRMSRYTTLEEALNDTLSRILAIASVHDLLSREDLDHVGLVSIAETLIHHQQSSLLPADRRISFKVRGDDVTLSMNQATQMALVLNELILNAVEHGFEVATQGEVHISIEAPGDEVSVWVSNNGDPLPEGFDPTVASHLGLKIVENLARALGGRFKMRNDLGWTVTEVKFPKATGE